MIELILEYEELKTIQQINPRFILLIIPIGLNLPPLNARVAELVDALDSKSSFCKEVRVRFPPRVQKQFGV